MDPLKFVNIHTHIHITTTMEGMEIGSMRSKQKTCARPIFILLLGVGVLVLCITIFQGIRVTRQLFFHETTPHHCDSDSMVMHHYCTKPEFMSLCFTTVDTVERLLRNTTAEAIFNEINKLEPQTSPPVFWAVDQSNEAENSHLDTNIAGTADYFDNNAYFYNVEQNKRSTLCGGGWSYGFWKTLPQHSNGTSVLSVQIQYCEDNESRVRVCGSFNVAES